MGNWFGLRYVIFMVSMEMLRLHQKSLGRCSDQGLLRICAVLETLGCLENSFRSGLFYPICDGNTRVLQHRLRIHMQTEDTTLRVKNPLRVILRKLRRWRRQHGQRESQSDLCPYIFIRVINQRQIPGDEKIPMSAGRSRLTRSRLLTSVRAVSV